MHLIFKLVLVICATAALLWSLPLECISFGSEKPTPLTAEHCDCDTRASKAVENQSLARVPLPSNMVCVDKSAPVLFYPLPIPDLRDLVLKLMNNENVGVQRINEQYASIGFPNAPIYFHQQPKGLLILIKSSAGNVENRKVCRSTWANSKYLSKLNVPIAHAFLIGTGQYFGTMPAALSAESKEHRDIIFQDSVDTYRNITHKTMGGLKWALEVGPEFEFLVTLDDDMYFSVEQAIFLLQSPEAFNVYVNGSERVPSQSKFGFKIHPEDNFLAGHKIGGPNKNPPSRDPANKKLYVSWADYPLERFPFFPSGRTIFFSRRTVKEIYVASPYVKHLAIEDVYVGIIAFKLEIPLTDITDYIINAEEFATNPSVNKMELISWHIPRAMHEMRRRLWLETHGNN